MKKKLIIITAIVLPLFLISGISLYFLGRDSAPDEESPVRTDDSTSVPSDNINDDISDDIEDNNQSDNDPVDSDDPYKDWKSYNLEEYNISFRYPPEWSNFVEEEYENKDLAPEPILFISYRDSTERENTVFGEIIINDKLGEVNIREWFEKYESRIRYTDCTTTEDDYNNWNVVDIDFGDYQALQGKVDNSTCTFKDPMSKIGTFIMADDYVVSVKLNNYLEIDDGETYELFLGSFEFD